VTKQIVPLPDNKLFDYQMSNCSTAR